MFLLHQKRSLCSWENLCRRGCALDILEKKKEVFLIFCESRKKEKKRTGLKNKLSGKNAGEKKKI